MTEGRRGASDPWSFELDLDLRQHIQHCPCSCNHMGYGNYLDYHLSRELPLHHRVSPGPCNGHANHHQHHHHHAQQTDYPLYQQHYPYQGAQVRPFGSPDGAPAITHTTAINSLGGAPLPIGSVDSCSCSTSESDTGTQFRGPWCVCLVVCIIVSALAAALGLPIALGTTQQPTTPQERLDAVHRLLRDAPLIDAHNDLPWNLRKFVHNRVVGLNMSALRDLEPWARSPWSQTDIPRLRAGLLGAQFWSAYVPCGAQHLDAVQLTLEQIDVIKRFVELHPQDLALAGSSHDILDIHRRDRIASLIGVEGGHSLGNSLAVLRTLYNLGARYLTITHTCDTPWATCSNTTDAENGGLTPFGVTVIREMNRLGMMVDLSHTSVNTAKAALNATRAPVIFSHSGAFAICNSTRNLPDDLLRLVAANGGVVMVNFYALLVSCNHSASLQDVLRHIKHIRTIAGVEHVGLGAGYDGINMTPTGLEDVSRYPHLLAELLADPEWTEQDVAMLAGQNMLRVFSRVEAVRDQWKLAAVLPAEDIAPPDPMQSPCSYQYS